MKKIKEAIKEGLLNGLVAFIFIYATLCTTGQITLINAMKPAALLAGLRFATYLAEKIDYIELPSLKEESSKDREKERLLRMGKFIPWKF